MSPPDPLPGPTRRDFIKQSATGVIGLSLAGRFVSAAETLTTPSTSPEADLMNITLTINGRSHRLQVEPRTTLLDTLRDRLELTGTKKGCDRGECGACTVHVDGQRMLSCTVLAVMADGREISTIEGLARGEQLHPLQAAFIEHDAFQCGYCTSGQIMSGLGCIQEGHAHSAEEIRESMSGNICRCAAYPQIRAAILDAAQKGGM